MESCDFLGLLKEGGHLSAAPGVVQEGLLEQVEGTTIMAVRYADGVLVAGDRRATMGNLVVYDRADKVLSIDDDTVMAIAGSPSVAYDIARMLEMSVQYYRRSQLQRLSLDGKLRTLSRLLRQNLPMAIQGIGAVVPIYAAYDQDAGERRFSFTTSWAPSSNASISAPRGRVRTLSAVRSTTRIAGARRSRRWRRNRQWRRCSRC